MPTSAATQLEIAAAFVRLYVFLSQYLDRCGDESQSDAISNGDLDSHLAETRRQLMQILSVNPVVKRKLTAECDRILELGASCLRPGGITVERRATIHAEREVLKHKTSALSDLVAVFRALD